MSINVTGVAPPNPIDAMPGTAVMNFSVGTHQIVGIENNPIDVFATLAVLDLTPLQHSAQNSTSVNPTTDVVSFNTFNPAVVGTPINTDTDVTASTGVLALVGINAAPQDQPPIIVSTPAPVFLVGLPDTYDMKQHVGDDGLSAVIYTLSGALLGSLSFNTNTGILTYDGTNHADINVGVVPSLAITTPAAAIVGSPNADFAPTFNGAQDPATVANSTADYLDSGFGTQNADARATTDITLSNSASDCVINVIGTETGGSVDQGSSAQASTNIFNLNERPDTVRIRLVSAATTDSDAANYPSTTAMIGSFTDDVDFNATNAVLYGYQGIADVEAEDPFNPPPFPSTIGAISPVVEFTFKKPGFNDLTVTYKINSSAVAEAEDFT